MTTLFKDNASSVLSTGISSGALSITVTTGHGDRFPIVVSPDICYLTLEDAAHHIEIVKVTGRGMGADTMTIVRAQQGTTARAWLSGDIVELRLTATTMAETIAHPGESTDAHAASAIGFTPTGGIGAVTVQEAIAELDSEKSPVGHNHDGAYTPVGTAQPIDEDLTALAALASTGMIERTGSGSMGLVSATTAGKALLTAVDLAAQKTILGIGDIHANMLNGVLSKSASYNIDASADRGKLIDFSGLIADVYATLPSVEDGLAFAVRNSDSMYSVTLKAASDIDGVAGATGVVIPQGGSLLVAGSPTVWKTVGRTSPGITSGTVLTKNPLVFGTTTSQAHGLGREPSYIRVVLECITGENEWVSGDRIDISTLNPDSNVASFYGINVYADATNVYLKIYNGIYLFYKTSAAGALITAANWKIMCYPYKFA